MEYGKTGMHGQWMKDKASKKWVRPRPPWWVFARSVGLASVDNAVENDVLHYVS